MSNDTDVTAQVQHFSADDTPTLDWRTAEYLAQQAKEREVVARIKVVAAELLDLSKWLGWGSGEPIPDAKNWLDEVDREADGRWQRPPRVRTARQHPYTRQPISPGTRRRIWDRDGWACQRCGSHVGLEVDHIVPVARGGSNDDANLQTLCSVCNRSKGAR